MSQVATQGSEYQAESAVPHTGEEKAKGQVPSGRSLRKRPHSVF